MEERQRVRLSAAKKLLLEIGLGGQEGSMLSKAEEQFNKMKDLLEAIVFGQVFYVVRTSSCLCCVRYLCSSYVVSAPGI